MIDNINKNYKIYRWLVLGILCVIYLIVMFHRLALGVIRGDLVEQFNLSSTAFANLSSMYFYVYMLMQIPIGILVDTLGVRKTVTAGSILSGIGSIIFAFSPSITVLFAGRFLVGLGVSVVFISILKIITEWFHESEFGTMSSLVSVMGNVSNILTQVPLVLIVGLITWKYTFAMVGVISLLLAVLCYVIVRNRPSEKGFKDINPHTKEEEKIDYRKIGKVLWQIIKNPYTWSPFMMVLGFQGANQTLIGTWGQAYIINVYGLDNIAASKYITYSIVGMAISSIFFGRLSDKLLRRKVPMIILGAAYLLAWTLIVFYNGGKPSQELLTFFFVLAGFSYTTVILSWACGKEVNDPLYAGLSTSFVNIGGFTGAAIIPVIVGIVIDKYKPILNAQQLYQKAFFFCLISVLIGFISLLFLKETRCKNIYNEISGQSKSIPTE